MSKQKRSKRQRHLKRALARAIKRAERSIGHEQTKPRATMVCDPGWLRRVPK